jgi:alkylation response protein AidB-like acyl-CoA dehydrogenase
VTAPRSIASVRSGVDELASEWTDARSERQARRSLDPDDFAALADIGFLHVAVPVEFGGLWESVAASTRPICELLRVLARADSSVALVLAMHPAVLGYWLATDDPAQPAWRDQARAAYATAAAGSQWGTITSEPGSGGDIMKTRTQAVVAPAAGGSDDAIPGARYLLTGDKHFGSGFGISDFMLTTARAEDDDLPSAFFVDMRPVRTGASNGVKVTAEWDGAGMRATQSHAARFESMPATRLAWVGDVTVITFNAGPLIASLFTAVVLGVFDAAIDFARESLSSKRETMRAYEQVEWSRADLDHWVATQAFDGALRTVEGGDAAAGLHAGIRAKTAVAEAAEGSLVRLGRVLGGGTFSQRSPVAAWLEDVRALGFLRPPWGLAYDSLFATSFPG